MRVNGNEYSDESKFVALSEEIPELIGDVNGNHDTLIGVTSANMVTVGNKSNEEKKYTITEEFNFVGGDKNNQPIENK